MPLVRVSNGGTDISIKQITVYDIVNNKGAYSFKIKDTESLAGSYVVVGGTLNDHNYSFDTVTWSGATEVARLTGWGDRGACILLASSDIITMNGNKNNWTTYSIKAYRIVAE